MANTNDYKYELDTPCLTIDIDVGLGRTGVLPESALELTGHITNSTLLPAFQSRLMSIVYL